MSLLYCILFSCAKLRDWMSSSHLNSSACHSSAILMWLNICWVVTCLLSRLIHNTSFLKQSKAVKETYMFLGGGWVVALAVDGRSNVIPTLGLHLGFSAKLKIWQVPACKMEPRSVNIAKLSPAQSYYNSVGWAEIDLSSTTPTTPPHSTPHPP